MFDSSSHYHTCTQTKKKRHHCAGESSTWLDGPVNRWEHTFIHTHKVSSVLFQFGKYAFCTLALVVRVIRLHIHTQHAQVAECAVCLGVCVCVCVFERELMAFANWHYYYFSFGSAAGGHNQLDLLMCGALETPNGTNYSYASSPPTW